MSTRGDVHRLAQPVITVALELAVAERHLPAGSATTEIERRTASLIHVCRAFMDAVEGMPPGEMPRSWRREDERKAS